MNFDSYAKIFAIADKAHRNSYRCAIAADKCVEYAFRETPMTRDRDWKHRAAHFRHLEFWYAGQELGILKAHNKILEDK